MRHPARHPKTSHILDLLHAYNPAHKPVLDTLTASYYHTASPYYPMFMLNYYLIEREAKMAKSKGSRRRQPIKKGEYTFVRLSLNAAEKLEAKSYAQQAAEKIDQTLTDVLRSGHKVSFSYSETNDQVTCTFTGKPDESVNEYRMLTSFGSSWWIALCVNLFKSEVYFQDGVWEDMVDEDDFG